MLNDIEKLCQIQEEDLKLVKIQKKTHELPEELKSLKENVISSKNAIETEKDSLKRLLVDRKKLELELEGKLENIKKLDGQLMMIKTNQEYKALEKEIFGLKSDCSVYEDKILENMEKAEDLQKKIEKQEQELSELQTTLKEEEVEINRQINDLKESEKQISEEKQKLISKLDERLYKRYNKIFQHNKDKVVVPVVDKTCGGCHIVLPPQVINDVYKGAQIIFCETCTRILYWADGKKQGSSENKDRKTDNNPSQ